MALIDPRDRRPLALMLCSVIALHVLGITGLIVVVTQRLELSDGAVFGVGLGITAYTLGMRHAFDADHIAAIDNTTRKLIVDGRRPVTVGFWFSLGHSSVVFALCALLALGVKALAGPVTDEGSALQALTGLIGTSVSGVFLLTIGILNLIVLVRIVRIFLDLRRGEYNEAKLESHLNDRGVMSRYIGRVLQVVRRPWHMYPVGLLFGLGFDTATEVALLVLAGAAAVTLPWYAILCLPILFTAGMSLFDSADGYLMNHAYGWAHDRPVRRVFYNIAVTTLSVVVALLIGGIEIIGLIAEKLSITSGPVAWIGAIDLEYIGYLVVAAFVIIWVGAVAYWKLSNVRGTLDASTQRPLGLNDLVRPSGQ